MPKCEYKLPKNHSVWGPLRLPRPGKPMKALEKPIKYTVNCSSVKDDTKFIYLNTLFLQLLPNDGFIHTTSLES